MTVKNRQKMPVRHLFQNLTWCIRQLWSIGAGLMTSMALIALTGSFLPASLAIVTRSLVNSISHVISNGDTGTSPLLFPLIILFVLTLLQSICVALAGYCNQLFKDKVHLHISHSVMSMSSQLDVTFFEDAEHQDMLNYIRQNTAEHLSLCYIDTLQLTADLVKLGSLSIVLIMIEPLVVFMIVPLFLPYLLFKLRLARDRFSINQSQAQKRRWTQYYVKLLTQPHNIPEIKILGIADYFLERFKQHITELFSQSKILYRRGLTGNLVFSTIANISILLILIRIIRHVSENILTIGDVVIFLGASANLRNLLESSTQLISRINEHAFYVRNYRELNKLSSIHHPSQQLQDIEIREGRVEVKNISFCYPSSRTPVLQNVTLTIEPGETVALVGANAAGKTTLAKLIAGLYSPDIGTITIDGQDISKFPVEVLGKHIAFVFQNFGKFETTVSDNIALGDWPDLEKDEERIVDIARKVKIDRAIEQYPEKFKTLLGRQFGTYNPSGGQWQYIAIARAFARNSSLLILDEPTASLDIQTENKLFNHFQELTAGKTTVLISHRFSTVKMADRIVVMGEGRILESGSHEELMAKQGTYASMYRLYREQSSYTPGHGMQGEQARS